MSHVRSFRDKTVLAVPSDPRFIGLVREWSAGVACMAGMDGTASGEVSLAVVEAFANVVRHSYEGDATKKINLAAELYPDRIEIEIRDYGKTTHPAEIRARDLDDVQPGGLGVHFIREIMDEVVYEPGRGLGMRLVMVRRVDRRRPSEDADNE